MLIQTCKTSLLTKIRGTDTAKSPPEPLCFGFRSSIKIYKIFIILRLKKRRDV
nr:MAG TPA: hypothetical protein [Caudoviricetes sp.]